MYILSLVFALNGFIISGLLPRFFGRQSSIVLSTFSIFLLFLLSIFIFYEICLLHTIVNIKLFNWVSIDILTINFGLLFDSLTSFMLLIICSISFFVHLYSLGYMKYDPYILRFISYLSLFTFFMLVVVTSDNFVQMFLGWEGVGLCSYLLISFWFTRIAANKAALKAMIMNRISDVFFIYGIVLILLFFNTVDYQTVFFLLDFLRSETIIFLNIEASLITFICLFLFIGGVGKSAQLGLHTWLPDAMEGPTPVSSLLHAATMVTAGVFLILRCSFFFEFSDLILFLIMIIGGLTALSSSIIGFFQYDIKKVIAYSTCSQLGYMFFSCGLSNYNIAIFHLFNHAFFKALLFLSAGSVIHALSDEQDMRRMGSMVNFLPFTYFAIFLGSLAIMGFPFLTGFYSKDLLLELTFARFIVDSQFIYFLGVLAAFFTSIYSVRLFLFVFFNYANFFKSPFASSESYLNMSTSMFALVVLSIFVGYFFHDLSLGWGSFLWNNSIFSLSINFAYIDSVFLHPFLKNIPIIISLVGLFLGIYIVEFLQYFKMLQYETGSYFLFSVNIFSFVNFLRSFYKSFSIFFFNGLFFNSFYNSLFNSLFLWSYNLCNKFMDKGFLEYLGPFGIYRIFRKFSLFFKIYPPSVIFFSIGFMFFFIMLFLFYVSLIFYLPSLFFENVGLFGFLSFVLFRLIYNTF